MAGEISALTLLGAPSAPLEIEVLDPGDTTMSSSGTNKRAILAGPYLIETITNSVAGEFDFSSIPAGFSRLLIKGYLRSNAASATASVELFFNGDTTKTNYSRQHYYVNDGTQSVTEGTVPRVAFVAAASAASGRNGLVQVEIEGYASSILKCAVGTFMAPAAAEQMFTGLIGMSHDTLTAAITQIQVQTADHPTSGLTGTLSLYGMF